MFESRRSAFKSHSKCMCVCVCDWLKIRFATWVFCCIWPVWLQKYTGEKRTVTFECPLHEIRESTEMWTAKDNDSLGDLVFVPSMHCSVILIKVITTLGTVERAMGNNASQGDSCAMIYGSSLTLTQINHLLLYIIHYQMRTLTFPML